MGGTLSEQGPEPAADFILAAPTAGRGTAALVAVGDADSRAIMVAQLRRLGWATLAVPDGRDAIVAYLLNRSSIGLVLLDASLPGRDGRTTLDELRAAGLAAPCMLVLGRPTADATPNRLAANAAPQCLADLVVLLGRPVQRCSEV